MVFCVAANRSRHIVDGAFSLTTRYPGNRLTWINAILDSVYGSQILQTVRIDRSPP